MSLPLNQVVVGDCTEVMRTWPADSIDLVVTSPPYWGLRSYGPETVRIWGGLPECEHTWDENTHYGGGGQPGEKVRWQHTGQGPSGHPKIQTNFCAKCGAWRGSLGLEPHPQLFIDHLVEICREIKRVLKPTGTFFLNLGDTYYGSHAGKIPQAKNPNVKIPEPPSSVTKGNWLRPKQKLMIPSRVAIALQHDGWILRNSICWWKPNHMPSSVKDRLTNAYEPVFLFAKARRYYFDLDAIRAPHKEPLRPNLDKGSATQQGIPRINVEPREKNPLGKNPGDVLSGSKSGSKYLEQSNAHSLRIRGGHTGDYTHPRGKNPGDLWRIPTRPFPGAHFATFPPALIEPIVKAGSPRWVCSKCGKPRTRITKNPLYEKFKIDNWTKMEDEKIDKYDSKFSERQGVHSQSRSLGAYRNWLREHGLGEFESGAPTETVGWSDCGCGEKWVGGIVLDPFGGSGTVGQVARKLGRRFILIEIIPEYGEMAEQRVRGKYKPVPEGVAQLDQFMESEGNG